MKTTTVKVTRHEYRTTGSKQVKLIGSRPFDRKAEAEKWISEKAHELQTEELLTTVSESEEMELEMIDNGFNIDTFGNKTYAPFNNGAARKGYYLFEIL